MWLLNVRLENSFFFSLLSYEWHSIFFSSFFFLFIILGDTNKWSESFEGRGKERGIWRIAQVDIYLILINSSIVFKIRFVE